MPATEMQQQTLSSFLVLKAPAAAAPTNLSKGASKLKKKNTRNHQTRFKKAQIASRQ
jgi:hypothetical protein